MHVSKKLYTCVLCMCKSVNKICFFINKLSSIGLGELSFCAILKGFFLELVQSGYHGPDYTCPDHDSTSTCNIGTCLL